MPTIPKSPRSQCSNKSNISITNSDGASPEPRCPTPPGMVHFFRVETPKEDKKSEPKVPSLKK